MRSVTGEAGGGRIISFHKALKCRTQTARTFSAQSPSSARAPVLVKCPVFLGEPSSSPSS